VAACCLDSDEPGGMSQFWDLARDLVKAIIDCSTCRRFLSVWVDHEVQPLNLDSIGFMELTREACGSNTTAAQDVPYECP